MRDKIGWIGTGIMGNPMCARLLENGYKVVVYNRTKAKAENLLKNGAEWGDSPLDVARRSDVIITIVGFPQDVRTVYLGSQGILKGSIKNKILVDMTTTEPQLAIEISREAKKLGGFFIDAPVSGGDIGAQQGTLSIMVGGNREAFEKIKPILQVLGKNIVYQGPAGSGQHAKMCNQIVIAGTMIGICESLLYGYRAGLDPDVLIQSISQGAAACWGLNNLAPRIIRKDYEPGFIVEHFIKDMGIALREAERMNVVLPGLALVHQLYISLRACGYGRKGTQALILALERLSGSLEN